MASDVVAVLHVASAVLALLAGLAVLRNTKGTRRHRRLGHIYVVAMVTVNITALSIFRLSGAFGPFHVAAVVSLTGTLIGIAAARFRWPTDGWLDFHYHFMGWSYVGLVAAAVSELAVRLPAAPFWPAVAVGTFLVFVIGAAIIYQQQRKLLAPSRRQRFIER